MSSHSFRPRSALTSCLGQTKVAHVVSTHLYDNSRVRFNVIFDGLPLGFHFVDCRHRFVCSLVEIIPLSATEGLHLTFPSGFSSKFRVYDMCNPVVTLH